MEATNTTRETGTMTTSHAAICNAGHHSDSVPCSCYCHESEWADKDIVRDTGATAVAWTDHANALQAQHASIGEARSRIKAFNDARSLRGQRTGHYQDGWADAVFGRPARDMVGRDDQTTWLYANGYQDGLADS